MPNPKSHNKTQLGDFQTPLSLAEDVCRLLRSQEVCPGSIVEPTCGLGSFLEASLGFFPGAKRLAGLDVQPEYISEARSRLPGKVELQVADFFSFDWEKFLSGLPSPILLLGNLPWVTNATLGAIGSVNLPAKSNFHQRRGFDAITGKSNFDISEWMLIKMLNWFSRYSMSLAILCKTAVARKALHYAWTHGIRIESAIFNIDAKRSFDVSVDACLFRATASTTGTHDCAIYAELFAAKPVQWMGFRDNQIVADVVSYARYKGLMGKSQLRWRSGIKHDCSKVMELRRVGGAFENGLGENVLLEDDCLFPMLKSSDVAKGEGGDPRQWMIVTQTTVGENTEELGVRAPKTWQYLMKHENLLSARKSSIYRKRPRFSVFGVGPYTFSPFKVAISGFYKKLHFSVIRPFEGKPVVLDDTVYFLPFRTEHEAELFCCLLNSEAARDLFQSLVFWDAKRPITVDLLQKCDLAALARKLGEPLTEFDILNSWNSASHSDAEQSLPLEFK